jgi:divalent metal cation (Fe/Co/Zn/Cd) transporter
VLFEDSAALLGLIAAAAGIFAAHYFNNPHLDGVASIAIGLILASVALIIGYESMGLQGADPKTLRSIRAIARTDSAVAAVKRLLTMHFGPDVVLLTMDVEFRSGLSATEVDAAVDRLEKNIGAKHPEISQIFIEAKSISERRVKDGDATARGAAS